MSRASGIAFRLGPWRFRPTLVPTLMTIPALAALLALGTWQLERLEWKTNLIESRTSRVSAPAIALPGPGADPEAFEFHRVRVAGAYLHGREMYLGARSLQGRVGYHVITPFRLEGGGHVLVDRGWVPLDRKEPGTRPEGQVEGPVTIEAVLRTGGRKGWAVPDNRPEENFWFFVDVPAMARHVGLEGLPPYYLEAAEGQAPGGLPVGGQTRIDLPNDHLSYAITWYALAAALVVIYLVYHRVREA